ncbi:MAG: alcohol dehydrogenase catalytic domain-containing protein [Chloroflexi bacterium]|nr:alcohol dehydrogenase catalytic domain-containing protein [Chloroflexota bacterium]
MKAVVLRELGGPLTLEEVPKPEIGPSDALVRVRACGVCFTDVKIRAGKIPDTKVPLILGHEPAGEVAAIGSEVKGAQVGDRVVVHFYVTCGVCEPCRTGHETLCRNLVGQIGTHLDGGYAEYLRVPAVNLCPIPDHLPFAQAAILADAVATPLHALRERAKVRPGQTVAIVGAGGGLGLHAVQIARLCGGKVIAIDVDKERLQRARELGADQTVLARDESFDEEIKRLTRGLGVDAVLELVGTPVTLRASLRSLKPRGKLVIVGYKPDTSFELDPLYMVITEKEILGSRATTKQELADLVELVSQGKVQPIVSQTFSLDEVERAHSLLREGRIIGRAVLTI